LDRYPYGCTEQIASRAMPLGYLNDVAIRAGLAGDPDIRGRVEKASAGVLANQSAPGSFGLWARGGDDMRLAASVTDFATRAGLAGDPDIRGRVGQAIAGVLATQSPSGPFGLWAPGGVDMWLDSYVTDFLTRARQKGYSVPAEAFDLALDNLKTRLAYASDFQ